MKKRNILALILGILIPVTFTQCDTPEEIQSFNEKQAKVPEEVIDIPNVGKLKRIWIQWSEGGSKDRIYYIDNSQPITVVSREGKSEKTVVIINGVEYTPKQ